MANRSTLKEAMAEALAIRDTAIENAHDQLKESLTPHFKNLLAAKLREMEEEDEMAEVVAEEEVDESTDEEVDEANYAEKDKDDPTVAEADDDSEESEEEAEEEELPDDIPDEEPGEEGEGEEDEEVKDLDVEELKDLIRDTLLQVLGDEGGAPEDEYGDEAPIDDEEPVDMVGAEDDEIDIQELMNELEALANEGAEVEEELNEETTEVVKETAKKPAKPSELQTLKEELKAVYAEVDDLKKSLKESAVFSAKLLYLNKVFKQFNLSEAQKVAVVSSFDKAKSKADAEIIYETVVDTYSTVKNNGKTNLKEHRGFASKAAGNSTKPEKGGEIITEVSEAVQRMQKLAGIIK